jgi:DNA-binding transcriptional LysR family regulator
MAAGMDIAVVKTFLEVVRQGSFVHAAQSLNVTQTAVSARIRVLEEHLGRAVLIRGKGGVSLTQAGEAFMRHATTLVQAWENARRAVTQPGIEARHVRVGAQFSLWNPLMRHWLAWMRRSAPHIAVEARMMDAAALMVEVQQGALDMAVMYGGPQAPGVVTHLLMEEQLVLVRSADCPTPMTRRSMCAWIGAPISPPRWPAPFPI